MDRPNNAYQRGLDAKPNDTNPYPVGSSDYIDWQRGYAHAYSGAYDKAYIEGNVRLS